MIFLGAFILALALSLVLTPLANRAATHWGIIDKPDFARKIQVVGFDLNAAKIELYKSGIDPTNEVGNEVIKNFRSISINSSCKIHFDV